MTFIKFTYSDALENYVNAADISAICEYRENGVVQAKIILKNGLEIKTEDEAQLIFETIQNMGVSAAMMEVHP